jgi:hypothetical protein
MQAIGDIISYFSPFILIVTLKSAQKSNWGKIYDIFLVFPQCLYFVPVGAQDLYIIAQDL